jgi:myo-inositol-1(or 4)-monophosphatase
LPASDLDLLCAVARDAGEIATSYWRQSPQAWDKGADAGPVTEADLAVNDMLKDRLLAARPGYGWLSEETEDNADRLACRRVFIVDPIDGTRSFIAGEKSWSHSLAVAEDGQIVAAVVYLPLRDRMYHAAAGGGARLNDLPIRPSDTPDLTGANVLCARANLDASHWRGPPPQVKCHFRPSLAYRLALVAQGRFDAMVTLRDTWEWDVAAGTLIVSEAGGRVTDSHGNVAVFNNRQPLLPGLVAAPPQIHAQIAEILA